ncbi:hypothetical protein DFH07DRAFT_372905 [Mycena maculata]|uniref:DUF6534 domain-containing protein n=1 Tax=Mycena maculata TaxID=230809 RepID=A0AAD7NKZ3_9AGAR|nr:hypothetical protein DFH07DRAFT_372905 [Mycena maculata]
MAGVDLLYGPMLIGVLVNMMLYGIVFIQMFAYYQRFPNDSTWTRTLMFYLFLVATANVVIETGILYQPLILEYGTQAATVVSPRLLPGDSVLIAIVSTPIQSFAAWRISVITGSYIIPVLIWMLSLCSGASGILVSIMVMMKPEFRQFGDFTLDVTIWLVSSAACDIIIAVAMTYALWTRKTGFGEIDGQINRIVRLTVETGALTAVVALADVLLFQLFPGTTLNFLVDFPLSNLYICSLLAMLNSRERRKPGDAEHAHMAQTLTNNRNNFTPAHTINPSQNVFQSTEKLVTGNRGDSESDRSPTSQQDFYNYNAKPESVNNAQPQEFVRPRVSQLERRPRTIIAMNMSMPERF